MKQHDIKGRILFLCKKKKNLNNPSFIYRCRNIGELISLDGYEVSFRYLMYVFNVFAIIRGKLNAVVFHRPRYNFMFWLVYQLCKIKKINLVADVDDLIFDVNYANTSPGIINNRDKLSNTLTAFAQNKRALSMMDYVIVSTQMLKNHLQRLYPTSNVILLPNCVHYSWQSLAPLDDRSIKKITYFSGSKSHDRDFFMIKPALERFLRENPAVQLHIYGILDYHLNVSKRQLVRHKFIPFKQYPEAVKTSWVNLAPLEKTEFNQCKSALKVIESSYFGIPTICSPNLDYQRFEGVAVMVAYNVDDWYRKLCILMNDETYNKFKHGMREKVNAFTNICNYKVQYLRLLGLLAN